MVLTLLVALAGFSLCLCAVYLWKIGRRTLALLIATAILAVVITGIAFVFTGLPDVRGISEENATIAMLKNHADEDSLEHWFRRIGADWHMGQAWVPGESYTSPAAPCRMNCVELMQVAFTRANAFCAIWGDRITMRFDKQRKLRAWNIEPAADGC